MHKYLFLSALAVPLAVAACDGRLMEPNGDSAVSVRFAASNPSASTGNAAASQQAGSAAEFAIEGTNGTLTITGVSFVVAELELERLGSACEADGEGSVCDDYKAAIAFVKLPMSGEAVTVATDAVAPGDYHALDFEVKNLDADENDDSGKREEMLALLAAIRTTHGFTDFPEKASMVVEGTFTPTGGVAVAFRVYFDAEIEAEFELDPVLSVDGSTRSHVLTVDLQPMRWFERGDGTVVDLSRMDYSLTGLLFELDMEDGFGRVQLDD